MFTRNRSTAKQSFSRSLAAAAIVIGALIATTAATAATTAASSSYGEAVNLSAVPLLGGGVTITSGPVPQAGGTSPAAYNQSTSLASVAASSSLTGPILSTGVINVSAASPVPASNQAAASASVDNPQLSLVGNLQLVTLGAGQVSSSATIAGTCGTALTATGTSQLTGANLGGILASGTVQANPPPNTELLNVAGIRIVLNEQVAAGDGVSTASLTVNALHVYIANALLSGLGVLSGDLVIAHSQASLDCNGLANSADLSVSKSSSPNPVTAGQNLTYTITAANAGPDAATNVTVADPLPAGVALVSVTPSQGSCSGTQSISCGLGSIAAGANATVTIVIQPQASGTLVNSATASSSTSDPTPGNNTGSTSTTVNPAGGASEADLSVNGSAAPSPATVGNQLDYSIQVANAGPDGAGGVVVTDALPAGVTFVSANPSQGSCTGTAIVVCNLGTLASGAAASVAIAVVPTLPGVLVDTASVASGVADPNPGNNSITFSTTVGSGGGGTQADLSLVKTASPDPVTVGSPLTYTLAVHNAGPSAAAGVVTTDSLPAGVTFVSAGASQGSCSGTSTVTCNLGSVASGAGATVTIVVLPTASGTLANSATVSSSDPDPSSGNNTGSTSTAVNPAGGSGGGTASLTLSGTAAPNPVTAGDQLTYTILVKSSGPDGAGNVTLTDLLPAGVTFVSSLASQGSCSGTTTITCSLGTIAAGATVGIDIAVVPTVPGVLVDQVSVASSTTLTGNAPLRIVSTATAATGGNPADLALTATATPDPVTVGSPLTYTLAVHNNGPNAAVNVLASDILPAGVALVSASTTQGSCSGSFVIACNLGTVDSGGTVKITIVVTPDQSGTATDHANISSSNPDPTPGNNNATVTTTVNPASGGGSVTPADLSIVKTASPDPVTVGGTLTYTLAVANGGPASATGVVASDTLPANVTLVSAAASQGTCTGTTAISCNLGTLAAGASATVTIVVVPSAVGALSNTATVAGNDTDADTGNNTSTVTVPVLPAGGAAMCRIEDAPAATLLIPYFAVDLSSADGMDTFFTVVNAAAAPQLASVTLWSDWAIPVMTFDLYLTGYGTQTVDVRSLLSSGKAPATGPALTAAGGLSSANQNFPGCNAENVAGEPTHTAAFLQRALSGRKTGGLCYGTEKSASIATGYVTVDAANSCSPLNPSSSGYFAAGGTGVASDRNVLLGDYYYANPGANFAQGDTAVHIAADAASFGGAQYTFYARYVGGAGTDNRQPLGAVYGVHYLTTGAFDGTQLIVWRDTKSSDIAPVACGSLPSWAPLSTSQSVVWDEQEKNSAIGPGTGITPLATQLVTVGSAALPLAPQAGWLALDLSHSATSLFGDQAQGWVTVLHSSTSAAATWSERAWILDNACFPH